MPEGPEIYRAAQDIRLALMGKEIESVFFKFDSLKPFERDILGKCVRSVEARGKGMLIGFEGGLYLYSHNQLYGKWMIRKRKKPSSTSRDLRVKLQTHNSTAYLYSASEIEVLDKKAIQDHPYLGSLGLDILKPEDNKEVILNHLRSKRFARRSLGILLLDQHFLAGVGNYLRSEILHVCGIHPQTKTQEISDSELLQLYEVSCKLAKQSFEHQGITNELSRAMDLKAQGLKRWEYRHWTFYRNHRPCYQCQHLIEKIMQSGRKLFLCPHCQPKKREPK